MARGYSSSLRGNGSTGLAGWAWLSVLGACAVGLSACQSTGIEDLVDKARGRTSATIGPNLKEVSGSEPDIRVRIEKGVSRVTIGGPTRVIARLAPPGAGAPAMLATPVTLTAEAGGIRTVDKDGQSRSWGGGNAIELLPSDGRADGAVLSQRETLTVNKGSYPGVVQVRPQSGVSSTSMDVVAVMGVEAYVPGVLTHELFKDWPRSTYEVQAVAARTYALHERWRARREGRAFDVEDTDADQVYGGVTRASRALEATAGTRGMVLTQQGQVLRSYFSSTCGGRPASAAVAWPMKPDTQFNKAPALQAREREFACSQATFYRWTITRSDADVSARMRAWGKRYEHPVGQVGRIKSIRVGEVNDAGRPDGYVVTDEAGKTFAMSAEEARVSLNWAVPDQAAITRETRVHSGDFAAEFRGTQVLFLGRGWGHAVGMCQWCAKGFADQGWDWRKMAGVFYPGSEVSRAY